VAALGLVSGLTAAIVPAVQASRQSPVEVLAGRSAEVRSRPGRPLLGVVLVLLGLGATLYAMTRGWVSIAAAAVPFVLGLVALMPWLVKVTGGLAGRLPLPLRLSVRDAARHRVRTASAAAAVMAATMGAVAIGIGTSSAYTLQEKKAISSVPVGTTTIGGATSLDDSTWARLKAAAPARFPGAETAVGREARDAKGQPVLLSVAARCEPDCRDTFYDQPPIGDESLLAFLQKRRDPRAAAALAAGKAVAFSPEAVRDGMIELVVDRWDSEDAPPRRVRVPAVVSSGADPQQLSAVIPPQALAKVGFGSVERLLYVASVPEDEQRLGADLRGEIDGNIFAYSERGHDQDRANVLMVLLGAALLLVLGGTFAATGLAAADMRGDLDNLSAVGAAPRVRRLVVAAQAACIAGLGAAVGLVAGLVTGLALTWPLAGGSRELLDGPTAVDVPWSFLAVVVVGLPLVAALVAGVFTRTRPVWRRRVA
ncbi:MAG: ABC transporter permease, partial [Nonomuraea sp.]|nr:ABC transporter permease [Nonomuraea sp.]